MNEYNLLEETRDAITSHGRKASDVRWVGSCDGTYVISWREFQELADFTYDAGHGGQIIAHDLVVVGDDWWLERGEYDGAEWWLFKRVPVRQDDYRPFTRIVASIGWKSIHHLEIGEYESPATTAEATS